MADNNTTLKSRRIEGFMPILHSRDSCEEDALNFDSCEKDKVIFDMSGEDVVILDLSEENIVYFGEESPHQPGDINDVEGSQAVSAAVPESSSGSTLNRRRESTMHKCNECNKAFMKSATLKRHMRIHTGEQPFVCRDCHKAFNHKSSLARHKRSHTRNSGSTGTRRREKTMHKCNECNKAFRKPSALQRHMRVHTGERPFVCSVCQSAFNQKCTLDTHKITHTGEKPHSCSDCGRTFSQRRCLKNHVKRLHSDHDGCPCSPCGDGGVAGHSTDTETGEWVGRGVGVTDVLCMQDVADLL